MPRGHSVDLIYICTGEPGYVYVPHAPSKISPTRALCSAGPRLGARLSARALKRGASAGALSSLPSPLRAELAARARRQLRLGGRAVLAAAARGAAVVVVVVGGGGLLAEGAHLAERGLHGWGERRAEGGPYVEGSCVEGVHANRSRGVAIVSK